DMLQLAKSLADEPLILFNPRHRDDGRRPLTCRTRLLHTLPSWSMLHDGLAQRLLELDWQRIFVLRGPQAEDKALAASFLAAARKFGLRIVETRDFVAGNDPRKRDQINIKLLTGGSDYDALFVADALGDFARIGDEQRIIIAAARQQFDIDLVAFPWIVAGHEIARFDDAQTKFPGRG